MEMLHTNFMETMIRLNGFRFNMIMFDIMIMFMISLGYV